MKTIATSFLTVDTLFLKREVEEMKNKDTLPYEFGCEMHKNITSYELGGDKTMLVVKTERPFGSCLNDFLASLVASSYEGESFQEKMQKVKKHVNFIGCDIEYIQEEGDIADVDPALWFY